MTETTSTVVVGGHVLVVGGSAGTLIEPALADADAASLGEALERPGPGTAAAGYVDALSEATGRIERAKARFEAVADGRLDISEASDLMDGAIGLLEQLDREGHHREALKLARALNGLFALATRWADLLESLGIALRTAGKLSGEAGRAAAAWAEHELGTLHAVAGDADEADRRLSAARRLRRELGDHRGLAATEQNLGALCRRVASQAGQFGRRARRLAGVAAALLLLLVGGAGGAVLASRGDDPPDSAAIGEIVHLTVETEGPGTVRSTPPGIDCGDRCDADVASSTEIVLRADPDDGARFEGWSGACSDTGACELRPKRDRTVVATFREEGAQEPQTATLAVDPPTGGKVVSTPEGIDCGNDCSYPFDVGEKVELEPTADDGFRFTGWGNDCSDDGPCQVTMAEDRTVSATFTAEWEITVTVSGTGTVTSTPTGIECSEGECSHAFLATEGEVVLTAGDGTLLEWGGDCAESGREPTCTLALDGDHDATAAFSAPEP